MLEQDRFRARMGRRSDVDLPLLYEAVELKTGLVRFAWPVVVVLVASAIALALTLSGGPGELAGGLLAAVGVGGAFILVRCRCFETTVGTARLETRVGPAHRTVPRGMVGAVAVASATSWRRAYADSEVRFEVAGESLAIPSRAPDELVAALGAQ